MESNKGVVFFLAHLCLAIFKGYNSIYNWLGAHLVDGEGCPESQIGH